MGARAALIAGLSLTNACTGRRAMGQMVRRYTARVYSPTARGHCVGEVQALTREAALAAARAMAAGMGWRLAGEA